MKIPALLAVHDQEHEAAHRRMSPVIKPPCTQQALKIVVQVNLFRLD